MKKLIVIILILMFLPVSMNAAENQSIIFGGSYSIDNITTDADSAWLYMFYYATKVGSTTVTAEDLQWDGCYQYAHECTNDSTDGWTGWWVYFGESETVQLSEWAIVATARDSSYALHSQVDSLKDTTEDMSTRLLADTTGISESVADQVWCEDLTVHNIYGGAAVNILGLAGIQALALAPASHEQTTTRIAFNLTATTNDVFNGCLLNCRSGVNAGRTIRITDYEAYSGDSGVVIVSPPLVLAATENQVFVITGADHTEGDTNQVQIPDDTDIRTALGDSLYNERMDSLLTVLVEVKGYSLDLAYYWGACDGCYYRLYPEGGLADKDSAIIIDPSQGADSLVGKVIYKHGTDIEIVDTVYFYRDEPW